MRETTPRPVPWLERLALYIPGYGGYLERGNRRAADRALRDAVAGRLSGARGRIEAMTRQALDRSALHEIGPLERLGDHLDRVADRVRAAGSGTDAFYGASGLDSAKADTLHAADLALFELADGFVRRFDEPAEDRLARLEQDLEGIEARLEQRSSLLQGIR